MECIIRSEYCRRLASSYHLEGPSEYHFTGPPIGSPASLPSSNATQHPPSSRQSFGRVIRVRMVVSYRSKVFTIGNMILHASSPTPRHAFNAHAYTASGMRKCAQDIERGPTIMRFNFKWPCSDQILLTRLARTLVHVMPPMKTHIEAKSWVGEIWVVSRLCCSIYTVLLLLPTCLCVL